MKQKTIYTVAVDFDGTMVNDEFPEVGKNIGAGPVLRLMNKYGWRIILYTMRSDSVPESGDDGIVIEENPRKYLSEAVNWCKENKIDLYSVNTNPSQAHWTSSPKCHADFCIDDRNWGSLLTEEGYIDWLEVLDWFDSIVHLTDDEYYMTETQIHLEKKQ